MLPTLHSHKITPTFFFFRSQFWTSASSRSTIFNPSCRFRLINAPPPPPPLCRTPRLLIVSSSPPPSFNRPLIIPSRTHCLVDPAGHAPHPCLLPLTTHIYSTLPVHLHITCELLRPHIDIPAFFSDPSHEKVCSKLQACTVPTPIGVHLEFPSFSVT